MQVDQSWLSYAEQFPTITKWFGGKIRQDMKTGRPRFPLTDQLRRQNQRYLFGLEWILREQGSIAGFTEVIHASRNPTGFYDNILTLQFCQLLKESGFHVDRVFGDKGLSKRPDIRFRVNDRAAYAECKHLTNADILTETLVDHFRNMISRFGVSVACIQGTIDYSRAVEEVIRRIQDRIMAKEKACDFSPESFIIEGLAKVRLVPKQRIGPTPVSIGTSYRHITPDTFRAKIAGLMSHANLQFGPFGEDLNYLFVCSDLITLDAREIDVLLNGNPVIPCYRFEDEELILVGTRSEMNGLFLREDFRNLNGVVFVDLVKHLHEYPNPACEKGATRLFQSQSLFPLSAEWLDDKL
jgi:hypothetical protein